MKQTAKRVIIATFGALFLLCTLLLAACSLSYTVTLVYDNTQGSVVVDPDQKYYDAGDEVTVTVTPNEGYEVDAFTVNGRNELLTDLSYTFTVKDDVLVEVTFKSTTPDVPSTPDTYTVSVTSEHGTVTLDPAKDAYEAGENVTAAIVPDADYEVDAVTVNDSSVDVEDNTFSFTVEGETTVVVTYKEVEEEGGLPKDVRGLFSNNKTTPEKGAVRIYVYADSLRWVVSNLDVTVEAADVTVTTDEDGNTTKLAFSDNRSLAKNVSATGVVTWRFTSGSTYAVFFTPEAELVAATSFCSLAPYALHDYSPLADYEGEWTTVSGTTITITASGVTIAGTTYEITEDLGDDIYVLGDYEFFISLRGIYVFIEDFSFEVIETGFAYFVPAGSVNLPVYKTLAGVWTGEGDQGTPYTVQITEDGKLYINEEEGFVFFVYDDYDFHMYYVLVGDTELYSFTFSDDFGNSIYNETTGEYAELDNGKEPGPDPDRGDPIPEQYQGTYNIVDDDNVLGTVELGADYVDLTLNSGNSGRVTITYDDVAGVWDAENKIFYLSSISFELNGSKYQISRDPFGTALYIGIWTEQPEWSAYVTIGYLEGSGEDPEPTPSDPLPAVFVGTFSGEYNGVKYTLTVLSLEDITLTIGDDSYTATDISFNANWDRLTFTANDVEWTFYPRDDGVYDVFYLSGGNVGLYVSKDEHGGEEGDLFGEDWVGTYTTNGVSVITSLVLTANSITVNGDDVTSTYASNAFGGGSFTYNDVEYILRFDVNGVLSIDWVYFVKDGATPVSIDSFFHGTWVAEDGRTLVITEDSVTLDGVSLFAYDQIGEGEDATLYVIYNGEVFYISKNYFVSNALSFDFTPFVKA